MVLRFSHQVDTEEGKVCFIIVSGGRRAGGLSRLVSAYLESPFIMMGCAPNIERGLRQVNQKGHGIMNTLVAMSGANILA